MIRISKVLFAVFLTAAALPAQAPRNLQVFLLIGQSNMAGRGPLEPADEKPVEGVYMLSKDLKWVPAVDPLHFDKPDIAGVGLGRSFARILHEKNPNVSIGLVPAAFGGTSLTEWAPGGKLYNDAVKRAAVAMVFGTLRGILWHQGEADSGSLEHAETYRERFTQFIATLRKELGGENVPVIVGQPGRFYAEKAPLAGVVDEQLAMIPLRVPRSAFVTSEGLTDKGDKTHFDTKSYREFGRRYALAFLMLDPSWEAR